MILRPRCGRLVPCSFFGAPPAALPPRLQTHFPHSCADSSHLRDGTVPTTFLGFGGCRWGLGIGDVLGCGRWRGRTNLCHCRRSVLLWVLFCRGMSGPGDDSFIYRIVGGFLFARVRRKAGDRAFGRKLSVELNY